MRFQVVRSGGLAGIRLQATIDTRDLRSDAAAQVEGALRGLPFGRTAGLPSHPDAFQYQITPLDPALGARSVLLDESELPDALAPVIADAVARGTIVDT